MRTRCWAERAAEDAARAGAHRQAAAHYARVLRALPAIARRERAALLLRCAEPNGSRNTLHLDATGPLARPLGLLLGGVFRKVLRTENAGFKAAAEQQASLR